MDKTKLYGSAWSFLEEHQPMQTWGMDLGFEKYQALVERYKMEDVVLGKGGNGE